MMGIYKQELGKTFAYLLPLLKLYRIYLEDHTPRQEKE
jgi:hypothetical protein